MLVSTDELEDAEEEFKAAWRAASRGDKKPAAALRWSLQVDIDHGFDVVLQAMPASARSMRGDARLMADSCRTIELARSMLDVGRREVAQAAPFRQQPCGRRQCRRQAASEAGER